MSEENDTQMTQVHIRVPERLVALVDDNYAQRGYASRSEFIRQAIRNELDFAHGVDRPWEPDTTAGLTPEEDDV